ncbi:MAG TPA: hypothetical protein VFU23_03280 [Gemmatimonadales bacterium]|nr:hypothetical protein [Gemmatimonadales bacterium]
MFAHNLGYDARISDCFLTLPSLGWALVAHNVAPRGTWLSWRRDRATLLMVDSASVWPDTLAHLGVMFGLGKPRLPSPEASEVEWERRCQADVLILRTAVMAYLAWIEDADLGNFQVTGAGMAWAAFRHRWLRHNLLVHADPDALAAERRAMWTGRCEAYWRGTIGYQVVHEWDLHAAYARVARDAAVPVRLVGPMPPGYPWRSALADPRLALLAEVTVSTATPSVPAHADGRILWPVGTFTTTLWDVEIQAALDDGATVEVRRAWLYHAAPALHDWASWILDMLSRDDDSVPPWQAAIVKHWSRALIGRFAMQYSTWERWATMPALGAERRTMLDDVEGSEYDLMHVGTDLWRETGLVEWGQSMPAITGYVMAACRVRLWRIVQSLPEGCALYVDTDSLLATDQWHDQIRDLAATDLGEGLRLKQSWRGFTILGPRQIVTGDKVRMAGIPTRAVRVGRTDFEGEIWESLDVALRSGRPGAVRTMPRRWHARGVDRRRLGPGVGWTRPYALTAGGETS